MRIVAAAFVYHDSDEGVYYQIERFIAKYPNFSFERFKEKMTTSIFLERESISLKIKASS